MLASMFIPSILKYKITNALTIKKLQAAQVSYK